MTTELPRGLVMSPRSRKVIQHNLLAILEHAVVDQDWDCVRKLATALDQLKRIPDFKGIPTHLRPYLRRVAYVPRQRRKPPNLAWHHPQL